MAETTSTAANVSGIGTATNWLTQTRQPQQPSLLETVSSLQSLANASAQNDLMKQQLLNEQQQLKNLQLTNQTGQQALGQKMSMRHAQIMFSLVKLPDDQLAAGAQTALDDELKTQQIDPQRHAVMQAAIERNKDNPAALRTAMLNGLMSNLTGPEALTALTGPTTDTNVGGENVTRRQPSPYESIVNPNAPITTVQGGSVGRTLGPDKKSETLETTDYRPTITDPNDPNKTIPNPNYNTPQKVLLGDVVHAMGHNNWLVPTPPATPVPAPSAPPPPAPGGKATAAPPPVAPVPAPAPAPAGPTAQSAIPTFRTGTSAQQQELAKVSNTQYAAHQQMATNYKQSIFPTEQVYQLANTPNVNLGKGSEFWNGVYQMINSQVPDWVRQHGITPRNIDDVANREKIDKYLVQSMMQNSPFASQTDLMLQTAQAGQPTGAKSNETVSAVSSAMIGLRRMELAGFNAFQDYAKQNGIDPNTVGHAYSDFLTNWQKNIDPRAFMFDMTGPKAMKELSDKLSTKKPPGGGMSEKEKYDNTYLLAKKQGLYDQTPPKDMR